MSADSAPDTRIADAARLVHNLVAGNSISHTSSTIEIVETHISWVLLTGEYAYKIKKPVKLGFLDFSTLELRHDYCLLELELNRRFTPELYIDVVAFGGHTEHPVIGASPVLEWALRMRQFPAEARLDRQIENGLISTDDMRTFGESLARLHDQSEVFGADDPWGSVSAISGPMDDNFAVLNTRCTEIDLCRRLVNLANWSSQSLDRLTPAFIHRQRTGRVRECHGDLHLENLVRLDDRIMPFDCLEFDAALRRIDVINEVAFLLMDTMHIGRQDLGYSFLDRYLEVSGDYSGIDMLPFYCVYRSLVRAKVAVLRLAQSTTTASDATVTRYIELAERLAGQDREPCLIICRGLSGSGKTHISRELLTIMPAIRIRSDVVRKQMQQVGELETSGSAPGKDLYDPELTLKTYKRLARFSTVALTAGYDVVVDATFLRRADRDSLQSVAHTCAARFAILDCTADDRVLVERVETRRAKRYDASEADLTVLDWQRTRLEPLTPAEQCHTLTVDTGHDSSARDIVHSLRKIAS